MSGHKWRRYAVLYITTRGVDARIIYPGVDYTRIKPDGSQYAPRNVPVLAPRLAPSPNQKQKKLVNTVRIPSEYMRKCRAPK